MRRALLLCSMAACAASENLSVEPPPHNIQSTPDGGVARVDAAVPSAIDAGVAAPSSLIEDFVHRGWVELSETAVVDVNHGFATLPVQGFPELSGEGVRTFSDRQEYNGQLAAASIQVLDDATLVSSDAIQLYASGSIHISGQLIAGPGGVHIFATDSVTLDGSITSAGPVMIQVGSASGRVEIRGRGRVETTPGVTRPSAPIVVQTRGSVRIDGALEVGAGSFGGGDVVIESYGDVAIAGTGASIRAGSSVGGEAGRVKISTEAAITIGGEARLASGAVTLGNASRTALGGKITLLGASIELADRAELAGGDALEGTGGGVELRTSGQLRVGPYARVLGGAGGSGGDLLTSSLHAELQGALRAGDGDTLAGRVRVETAGPLVLLDGARLVAGDGGCTLGGEVGLIAAGTLQIAGRQIEIAGGRGGSSGSCLGEQGGGGVLVIAHAVDGPLESVARGGAGMPPGALSQSIDPTYRQAAPESVARVSGYVLSRPIPRRAEHRGHAPSLASLTAELPLQTTLVLELSDASQGPAEWFVAAPGASLDQLRDANELRYRLSLRGRRFDAPKVDRFELLLGP